MKRAASKSKSRLPIDLMYRTNNDLILLSIFVTNKRIANRVGGRIEGFEDHYCFNNKKLSSFKKDLFSTTDTLVMRYMSSDLGSI